MWAEILAPAQKYMSNMETTGSISKSCTYPVQQDEQREQRRTRAELFAEDLLLEGSNAQLPDVREFFNLTGVVAQIVAVECRCGQLPHVFRGGGLGSRIRVSQVHPAESGPCTMRLLKIPIARREEARQHFICRVKWRQ